jgi:hypothetical protein
MNFNFDFPNFARDFVPIDMRKPIIASWLKGILKPLKTMFEEFNSFVAIKRDEYKYTGKTISLRNLLTSRFGPGIIVENQTPNGVPYLLGDTGYPFNQMLGDTGYAFNPLLDESGTANLNDVDFIVKVPALLGADLDQIKGMVQKYKAAGMTFKIEEI